MDQGKKHTLTKFNEALLMGSAILGDVITFFIPAISGDIIGPILWTCATAFFWTKGMGFINGRRLATSAISLVAELIPVVQVLPTMTAGMALIIAMTRFQDKTGISVPGMHKGAKANVGGVRQPPPRIPHNTPDGLRPPNGGLVS